MATTYKRSQNAPGVNNVINNLQPNGSVMCRMCRAPGTSDSPLFHPCRCAGSMRHVHQECLLEWLKHSKKPYCEVCNHKFSLPSTATMDDSLDLLMVGGKGSTSRQLKDAVLKGFKRILSGLKNSILALLWFIALPGLSGLAFDLYFYNPIVTSFFKSSNRLWIFLSSFQHGLIIWLVSIVGLLGLMLLREFLVIHSTDVNNDNIGSKRKGGSLASKKQARDVAVNSGVATLDSSGDQPPLDSLSPTLINSKPSVLTDGIRPASIISRRRVEVGNKAAVQTTPSDTNNNPVNVVDDGRWITQITNKEYRAFLKRRELSRRREKINGNFEPDEWEDQYENELIPFDPLDNTNSLREYDLESIKSIKSAKSAAGSSNRMPSTPSQRNTTASSNGKGKKYIKFDPNVRCKVCGSSFCVDREHVVQASRLNNTSTAAGGVAGQAMISNVIPRPKHDLFNFAIFIEPDYHKALGSILDLMGFSMASSFTSGLFNWFIAVMSNLILLHTFVYIPFIVGKLLLDGYLLNWTSLIIKFFFESAIENILNYLNNFHIANDFLNLARISYSNLSIFANCSQLTVTLVGNIVSYRIFLVCTTLLEKYIAKHNAIFFVFEWLSFSKALIRFVSHSVIEFALYPMGTFLVFMLNLGLATNQQLNIFMLSRFFVKSPYICLIGLCLGGKALNVSISYAISMVRSRLRPGLFFILGDIVNGNLRYSMKNLLESSLLYNLLRNISGLIVFFCGFELAFLGAFYTLSKTFSLHIDSFNLLKSDQVIRIIYNFAVLYMSFKVLLSVGRYILTNLIKFLRLRSFIFGGRYISDVRTGLDGPAAWAFLPDQDDRQYNNWMRVWKISQVQVDPIDIAKLPVSKEVCELGSRNNLSTSCSSGDIFKTEGNSSEAEGHSRFKGYNVVYCPRFCPLRAIVLLLFSVFFLNISMILLAKFPGYLGRMIQRYLLPSLKINGVQVRIVGFGPFEIGNLAFLFILKSLAFILDRNDVAHRFKIFMKKAIAFTLLAGLVFISGLWVLAVLSPLLYPGDSIPRINLLYIFELGSLSTSLISIIWSFFDYRFDDSIKQLFSFKSGFSLIPFIQYVFGPLFVPIALSLVLPPTAVLFLAPVLNLPISNVISAQKSSFSNFLLFPLGWYAVRLIFSKHSSMVNHIRDESFINALKQRSLRNTNLSIEY